VFVFGETPDRLWNKPFGGSHAEPSGGFVLSNA
jgi:hypothetical protein